MSGPERVPVSALANAVTRRPRPLFDPDVERHAPAIRAAIAGRRVLAIGGAGSIGSACVRELLPFRPAALTIVDQDENALVELVRDLRSGDELGDTALTTAPLDFGAGVMRQFLAASASFDLVLHFAANKHVRAERDRFSLLQMLETNVLKTRRLLRWLAGAGFAGRFFPVSTDKAANPTNLLGASKRLMEMLAFADGALPDASVTSARFANVAFSNGSLLCGFLHRLDRGQPLAVPTDTRRWFVTPREAGQLCLLAATIAPPRTCVIPRLDAGRDLVQLTEVADLVVRACGHEPRHCTSEAEARRAAAHPVPGVWPVLHTPRDTGGEKEAEEFLAEGEAPIEIGCAALRGIPMPARPIPELQTLLDDLEAELQRATGNLDAAAITRRIGALLPGFAHASSERHLDQRM
ncbi:MAG: polysaccharide biosynthesis protein [Planctomycetes bacterium]|nr:polysaccharide biosynthesis protein [Planctomycetota bacterium]